jgi:hypothetical protein
VPDPPLPPVLVGTEWATRHPEKLVLGVVHNTTSATRLFDVIPLLAQDPRIQVVFTCTGSSPFTAGAHEYLVRRGVKVVTWEDAVQLPADLAVATSHGGALHELVCPLIILPHGMGYNKYLENRKPKTVFGMTPEWLLHKGRLIASSLVFSHEEQVDRLRALCPEAVPAAVVAGDPCLDRMLASMPLRAAYRRAIGVQPGQRLVFVSSTWGPESLYGRMSTIVPRLREQLPLDDFAVAVALHPNAWVAHSEWQIRMWLAACERSEVVVFPAEEGWRAGLIASDVVVGDYGSVTFYGAALGKPVLLAVRPHNIVDPLSPIGNLLAQADSIDPTRPLLPQVSRATTQAAAVRDIAGLATSRPGKSAALLTEEFYRLLDLPEPAPPRTQVVPLPRVPHRPATATAVDVRFDGSPTATATRYPAELTAAGHPLRPGTHLVVTTDESTTDLLQLADVIVHPTPDEDARTWIQDTLRALPGAVLATVPVGGRWLVGTRAELLEFTSDNQVPAGLWASLVLAWLTDGKQLRDFPSRVRVQLGSDRRLARVAAAAVTWPPVS